MIRETVTPGSVLHAVRNVAPSSSQQHQEEVDEDSLPSKILAKRYFEQLFNLLTLPGALCLEVWQLLMKLPTNALLKRKLTDLDVFFLLSV